MQKNVLQRHPGRLQLQEWELSRRSCQRSMDFTFCIITWGSAIALGGHPQAQAPVLQLNFTPPSPPRTPDSPSHSHYKWLTTSFLPICWGRETRPDPNPYTAHHSLPLHTTLQTGFCPKWFILVLEFSFLPLYLHKQAVPPKSLLIFKCVKSFWQDNHLSFSFAGSSLSILYKHKKCSDWSHFDIEFSLFSNMPKHE